MVHGIYLRNKPGKKWLLMSLAVNAESALQDRLKCEDYAKNHGSPDAEAAIKTFDYAQFIPEMLSEIKVANKVFN